MNWGKGIALFLVLFISFIVSMVYHAFTLNADLVAEDYYERESSYDFDKESRQNYESLSEEVHVEKTESGVLFRLPNQTPTNSEGQILFYRPDEKKLDCSFKLNLDADHKQILAYSYFAEGYYDISVTWKDSLRTYLFEDHIQF